MRVDLVITANNITYQAGDSLLITFDKPFRYWDKIEVTEAVAKEIKGINSLFYKKPKEVDGSYRWRKTWLTKEFDYYETQQPAKNNQPEKINAQSTQNTHHATDKAHIFQTAQTGSKPNTQFIVTCYTIKKIIVNFYKF
jgi:hypothetical protein